MSFIYLGRGLSSRLRQTQNGVPPPPPPPPVAPAITADPVVGGNNPFTAGDILTLTLGTVTGFPTPTNEWQVIVDGLDFGTPFEATSSPQNYDTTGLSGISTLKFKQIATNSAGFTERTSVVNFTLQPPATVPDAITNLLLTVGETSVDLMHSAPADGGAPLTDYIYEYKESVSGTWLVFADIVGTGLSATITGLTNDTAYDFRVSAVNSVGQAPVSNVVSGTPTSTLFLSDANTYWWDFTDVGNTTETTGSPTLSYVPEKLAGVANFQQTTKDLQPLVVTDGVNFNKNTGRFMEVKNTDLTNGSDGWYMALNFRIEDTVGTSGLYILSIARNTSNINSRAQILIDSSRRLGFLASNNEGSSLVWVALTNALNVAQWYTMEVSWDLNTDTAIISVDGVVQALVSEDTTTDFVNFPATDPFHFIFGNKDSFDTLSLNGDSQQMIFYDGVASSAMQQSIRDYLIGARP